MYPYLFGIPTWGLFAALGAGFMYALLSRLAARRGYHEDLAVDMMLIAVIGGLIGSRAMHVWEYLDVYRARPWFDVLRIDRGGMSWYGSFFTILPAAWWYARRKGLHPLELLDLGALFLPVAQGFGRIGCFFAGCCWGKTIVQGSSFEALAVRFPVGSPAWIDHASSSLGLDAPDLDALANGYSKLPPALQQGSWPVIPVQLFMAAAGFVVLGFSWWYLQRRSRRHGEVFAATFTLLALSRFGFEFLRADNPMVGALTEHQWISLVAALLGALGWALARRFAPLSVWAQ